MELWQPGVHPPALLAFEGQVHPIDPSWHVGGLGYRPPQAHNIKMLGDAAVLHFSGPAKPWLDIGFPELRSLWNRHVNFSDKFIRKCRILGWRGKLLKFSHIFHLKTPYGTVWDQREEGFAFSLCSHWPLYSMIQVISCALHEFAEDTTLYPVPSLTCERHNGWWE